MSEEKQIPGWRKRFLANRMAFESILFEKELVVPKPERKYSGILILLAVFLFHALLLTQAVLRGGDNFRQADSLNLEIAHKYAVAVESGGYSGIFKPELSTIAEVKPPLYYLSFFPVFKLFPSNPALGLALVNSFYLLIIMLSFYYAIRRGRNAQSAWLGASLAAGFPFIISLGRHVSPDLALIAFVSGAYCCYINAGEFENRKWSFWFGVCFALGLLTDTRFVIYVLPLVPFVLVALLNARVSKNMWPFLLLTLLLPAPWYFRNAIFTFVRDLFVANSLTSAVGVGMFNVYNIFKDLPLVLDGLHLVFLPLAAGTMLWLFLSLFIAYEEKELVLAWFLVPYCVFSVFSRAEGNIYPALIAFALAAGVMTPGKARSYFLGLTLLLPLLYQSGFVPSVSARMGGREVGVFGLQPAKSGGLKNADALKAVYARSGGTPARVQLVGEDDYFNADSMRLLAIKSGYKNLSFIYYPKDYLGFADFVLYKTASFSSGYKSGKFKGYSEEISRAGGWFHSVFKEEAVFELPDTSKLFVYVKAPSVYAPLVPGNYRFETLSLGDLNFEGVIADVGAFNKVSGTYDSVDVFIPQFSYHGVDLYSLRFRFQGLSVISLAGNFSDVRLTGCEAVQILSLKLREETLNTILKFKSSYFQNLRVELKDGVSIAGTYRDIGINLGFSVTPKASGLKMKLNRISFGMLALALPGDTQLDEDYADPEPVDKDTAPVRVQKNNSARRKLSPMHKAGKDLSELSGDSATAGILKASGYDKMAAKLIEYAKQEEAKQEETKRNVKPVESMRLTAPKRAFSWIPVSLFSINYDFLDEKTVPFKVKVNRIVFRNGLMTVK